MTAVLTIAGDDVSHFTPYRVTVDVGRDSVDSQPDGSVLTATSDGWQHAGRPLDTVRLEDSDGVLFHGHITDVDTEYDGTVWRSRTIAVGPLAGLGLAVVGDEPWPEETDSTRVARMLDMAGARHAVIGAAGPSVLPRDVDKRTVLELAQGVARDALGVLWEQPADVVSPIRYTPQRLRGWAEGSAPLITWGEMGTTTWATVDPATTWYDESFGDLPGQPPSLTLDASEVLAEVVFSQRSSTVLHKVRVVWGVAPAGGGGRPEAVLGDGLPEVRFDGQLADGADALAVADTILRARGAPRYRLSSIRLPLHAMSDLVTDPDWSDPDVTWSDPDWGWSGSTQVRRSEVRAALAIGTRLTLTMPPGAPVAGLWQGYVEGWTHELTDGEHWLTLRTSERSMTEPADTWDRTDPALTWTSVAPSLTWDQAVHVTPGGAL